MWCGVVWLENMNIYLSVCMYICRLTQILSNNIDNDNDDDDDDDNIFMNTITYRIDCPLF